VAVLLHTAKHIQARDFDSIPGMFSPFRSDNDFTLVPSAWH
jgi:hypothetical protein